VIQLFGPKVASFTVSDNGDMIQLRGLDVSSAETVKQALSIYSEAYQVSLEPYDGRYDDTPFDPENPKFFMYFADDETDKFHDTLVDIHVQRGEDFVCIQQNLDFELQDMDTINLVLPAC